jgi:hypothetical protein
MRPGVLVLTETLDNNGKSDKNENERPESPHRELKIDITEISG